MSFSLFNTVHGSLLLPDPVFGDSQALTLNPSSNRNRNQEYSASVPDSRPESLTLNWTFRVNTVCWGSKGTIDQWLSNTAGLSVSITDHNGTGYQGIILNPEVASIETRPGLWEFSIEFIGVRIENLLFEDGTTIALEDDTYCLILEYPL